MRDEHVVLDKKTTKKAKTLPWMVVLNKLKPVELITDRGQATLPRRGNRGQVTHERRTSSNTFRLRLVLELKGATRVSLLTVQ